MGNEEKLKPVFSNSTKELIKILFPNVESFIDSVNSFSVYKDRIVTAESNCGEVNNDKSKRASD